MLAHAHTANTTLYMDLEADADRLVAAVHVQDLALNSRVKVLQVVEADGGTWIRTIVGEDDRASWCRAG
ncbi:hypothetical protein HN018_13160 [Lichenicola cladoniae]|uniref:Uncharacterized protein n=1 Tax=Lichenicola cladoniae TaxID=1484109 RepID=A0A6M8HRD5_9PROT|nr:hypothetical protein [Lichenicola cladoniae]NPD68705.1 hypothetical protein [Acetobacteraceae bacterium]QKE90860.1 hypothetical protein HN018_13160 [Lichenicola cladoniae]